MAVADPKNVVLLSMVGTAGIVIVSDIQDSGSINGTHLLGLGVVSVGITAAADTVPKVAVPFALLIFAGILLTRGTKFFSGIGNAVSSGSSTVQGTGNSSDGGSATGVVVPPKQRHRNTGPSQVKHR